MDHFFSPLGNDAIVDIMNQSGEPLAIYSGIDFHIEFANKAMLKIWNREESVNGQKLENVLPVFNRENHLAILRDTWQTGKLSETCNTSFIQQADGKEHILYYNFKTRPLVNKDGKIYCIMETGNVVTKSETQFNNDNISFSVDDIKSSNAELTTVSEELLNADLSKNSTEKNNIASQYSFENQVLACDDQLKHFNSTISQLTESLEVSEERFRDLIIQSPVAMMLLKGDDYTVTMVNNAMLELMAKDVNIIGKSLFKEFPEFKGQKSAEMLVDTYKNGIMHSDNDAAVTFRKSGKETLGYFNFSYAPYIENGVVTGVINIAADVTSHTEVIKRLEEHIRENLQLEDSLVESEQRLMSIVETMAEGVGVIDASGQMVYANPMAQHILGLKESEIKMRTYDDPQWQNLRIDGTLLPSEEHPMTIMMKTQKPVTDYEIAVQPPEGDRIYLSINAAPMFDKNGVLTGGVGTFMDVTERRLITQIKDDFISIASHELKTPVTALKASLQILQKRGMNLDEETKTRLIDRSIESLNKLTNLIDDLLDTSRLEKGHLKMNKRTFTVKELFEDSRANFADQNDRTITFDGDINEVMVADSQQIGQVMINLINNAIKYAPGSDISIQANRLDSQKMMISVTDNGPGIPKEKLSRLFERYYRTDYQGQKFSGLGLGLFICSDIIRNHGGTIGVESEVGSGSKFWFTLPL